ncbi:MAG: hypothetical protein KF753_15860 [Caldilineaceae bacterium]|nr:hypothetical protein [Caldilineaceae bacterium]
MKQRRGWLWLTSGILLALLAGLMTFQIVNRLAAAASEANQDDVSTVSVIVATADIGPFVSINTGMVTLLDVPAAMAPKEHIPNIEDVIGKMTLAPITLGEILVTPRLIDPAYPDAPVLYTMGQDEVLVAIPTAALAGQLGLLSVGMHIDIAYTSEFEYADANSEVSTDKTLTTFLSLQNLEIKALMSRSLAKEGIAPIPDAILLSVAPQEALILKFLMDSGAPMDVLLRAPGNNALLAVSPVDEQYLVDYFQLDIDAPLDLASSRTARTADPQTAPASDAASDATSDVNSQIQSLLQDQNESAPATGGQ